MSQTQPPKAISLTVPVEEYNELALIAETDERSIAYLVRLAITEFLERQAKKERKAR